MGPHGTIGASVSADACARFGVAVGASACVSGGGCTTAASTALADAYAAASMYGKVNTAFGADGGGFS